MWLWAAFMVFILFLLVLDLGVFHRKAHAVTLKEALIMSGLWIGVALVFNVFVYVAYEYHLFGLDIPDDEPNGQTAAVLFLTGYVVEKSLELDNVFAIAMIFTYFRIPALYQHRVLFWGVVGALVMRAVMILAGVALIERVSWILYVFGAFLIASGVKMALERHAPDPERNLAIVLARRRLPVTHDLAGERFAVRIDGKLALTPLALTLVMIESSDVVFAVDSIPVIFAITQDSLSCVHQQHHGCAGSALAVFRLSGHYRSVPLPEALARPTSCTDRHTLGAVTVILAGGILPHSFARGVRRDLVTWRSPLGENC
jgi:TerC family integral membrane protein